MSESMLGAPWKSDTSPELKKCLFTTKMGMHSSICVSTTAMTFASPARSAGWGQPNMGPIAT
jgi:hypothetical protein